MRILISSLMLVMLASCSWANSFMNWSNCAMPTYSGERKDCENEGVDQAKASARPPAGNIGISQPQPYNGTPGMMPPSNHAGQSTMSASMPHNFGTTNSPTAAETEKVDEDFPAEYRKAKPGRESNFDMLIPPPPL